MTGLETVQKKLTDIDRDYIIENLYIGMRRCTSNEIIKRESIFEGIEEYLYLRIPGEDDEVYSVMFLKDYLKRIDISEEAAWECAEINIKTETEILHIENLLSDLLGEDIPVELDTPMYVITNNSQFKGASSILDTDQLYSLASDHGCRNLVCLPSSIHEWIVIPNNGTINIDEFSKIVKEINQTVLDDHDILSTRAYIYDTVKEVVI